MSSLVEFAALEALDIIGHEVVAVSQLRDRRVGVPALGDWRTEAMHPLAWDLEAMIVARLVDRFPDHLVIGAHRPAVITTRWRWLVGTPGADPFSDGSTGSTLSIALLSGDEPRVGAVIDLANGEVVIGHRSIGIAADPERTADAHGAGGHRLFLELGISCGGRWEASVLGRLAGVHRIEPRMLGTAAGALLAAARAGGTVLAIGVHERDLAAGVLIAEQAGLEAIWWHDAWPLAHVLVGRPDDLASMLPVVTDVVRTWPGAMMPRIVESPVEWAI